MLRSQLSTVFTNIFRTRALVVLLGMREISELLRRRSGPRDCLWQSCALVVYAQAQWTSRESRRSTQLIRFRMEP